MGARNLIPIPHPEDWHGVRRAFEKLNRVLGVRSTPTFESITLTGVLDVTGDVVFDGNLIVGGDVTFQGGITASGDLNMSCNEIRNFKIHQVADADEMYLLQCGPGQMCYRQDEKKFYGRLE